MSFLAVSSVLMSCEDEVESPSKISFAAEEFSVGESDGAITLGVHLDHPTTSDLQVTLSASGGNATSGEDYQLTTSTTIPKGETNGSFAVVIMKDVAFEGDETFEISVSATGVTAGGKYKVTIVDNDCEFDWIGDMGGYDVWLDRIGVKYDADVTIAQAGGAYTIDGLNAGFISDFWGETIQESSWPVTFTVDADGNITIPRQYIFTTLYAGSLYPYEIYGTGKVNTCDGNVTLDYEMDQEGFEVGAYCHSPGNWMTTDIFRAVLTP